MIPTHVIPYRNGELRIGWASWDDGSFTSRSIKFAYRDNSGKISRGSPELPFDILADMIDHAFTQSEMKPHLPALSAPADVTTLSKPQLIDERKALAGRLASLQVMIGDMPWVDWKSVYDQIGARYDLVKTEIANRP